MKKIRDYKKKWLMFGLILVSSTAITLLPAFVLMDKISFDPAQFVNQWMELFGGGIIMALMFYGVTQLITHIENKNEDEKYIIQITSDFRQIQEIFINRKFENKADALIKFRMIQPIIEMMNNKKLKLLLYNVLKINCDDIESELANFDSQTEDTRQIENKIESIINKIESWKMK